MTASMNSSPFHRGEQEVQTRLGVREKMEEMGQRFIRDYMPDEHQAFFAQLPFLLVGSVDASGRPWASVLAGRPGFVQATDAKNLYIHTPLIFGDPLQNNLRTGTQVGLLGIEYATRRRNRLTGKIATFDENGIAIRIDQTFGNCPQYIQARNFELLPAIDTMGETRPIQPLDRLDDRAKEMLVKADHFFIATHYSEDAGATSHGTDVSHRGGKPGFVRIEDDRTFTYPDYVGNYHFNTIGNLLLNPRAGLLFIDFASGDLLYLTCHAEIIWDSPERRAFVGAERLVRFTLDHGVFIENAMPIRWDFLEYSPTLEQTGSWEEVAEQVTAQQQGNVYRNYTVTQVEPESDTITSFYLEPEDGEHIHCHKAGQFLPIEIQPPGADAPLQRTYTISNAPNGAYYRLSIKREPAKQPDHSPGVSSNYFHDHVKVGSTIRALSPRGKFTLDETSTRPVVFVSAGVGITPMISMLEKLASDSKGCGCSRPVWFIHGAQNSKVQAFQDHVRALTQDWPCAQAHFRHSRPSKGDVSGADYDSVGRVDIELIKSLLPFDDYEFYLCGPQAFLKSLYDELISLDIAHERIHYEFFGPGTSLHHERPGNITLITDELSNHAPVAVKFARSGIEATWDPSKGTLLELAEAEGLQPAYSCRSGICQTCSTKVISGGVAYVEPPMTTPPEGEALICCGFPRAGKGDEEDEVIIIDL